MWVAKIKGEKYNENLWQPIAMEDLFIANNLVHTKTEELLEADLEEVFSFEIEEKMVERKLQAILYEIILYSNHCRAKVEMQFKKFNIQPPVNSYINFRKLELIDNF